jgi:hypothetical protein
MSNIPESFSSMKAKMNKNIRFTIDVMNAALEELCKDPQASPKEKLKATQEYLGLYIRLCNEEMKEKEFNENMKFKKLNRTIKQHEVDQITGDASEEASFKPVNQSKFSPTMN